MNWNDREVYFAIACIVIAAGIVLWVAWDSFRPPTPRL
jgi:hypothetical protein